MFTLMRIPLYISGKGAGYRPTEDDAVPFEEFNTKAEAEEALRVLNEFSLHPPPPMQAITNSLTVIAIATAIWVCLYWLMVESIIP